MKILPALCLSFLLAFPLALTLAGLTLLFSRGFRLVVADWAVRLVNRPAVPLLVVSTVLFLVFAAGMATASFMGVRP